MKTVQRCNVYEILCSAGGVFTTVIVAPCPHLNFAVDANGNYKGDKMSLLMGGELEPKAGCSLVMPLINEVDANGVYKGNIAFNWVTPRQGPFATSWTYDPRFNPPAGESPDLSLGSGDGRYLGLQVYTEGGACGLFSGTLKIEAPTFPGEVDTAYWGPH